MRKPAVASALLLGAALDLSAVARRGAIGRRILQGQAGQDHHRQRRRRRLRHRRPDSGAASGNHIPGNPAVIVQNMPGASTVTATNYLYNKAPKDGTVFGSFSRNIASQAVIGKMNIEADPRKFNWIGGSSLPSRVCMVTGKSGVKSAEEVFTREVIMAGSGAGSSLSIVPTALNNVLGTKFKLVEGYQGSAERCSRSSAGRSTVSATPTVCSRAITRRWSKTAC